MEGNSSMSLDDRCNCIVHVKFALDLCKFADAVESVSVLVDDVISLLCG